MKTTIFKYGKKELEVVRLMDKQIASLIDRYGIIEREVYVDLYQGLIQTVISQLISTKAAITVTTRLEQLVGGNITPSNIQLLSVDDIQGCGLTMRKANVIKEVTSKVINKELDLDLLYDMEDSDIIKNLSSIKGIGEWSAEMIMILTMQRLNILSYKDLMIRKGLCKLHKLDSLTSKEFERYRERYTPYGSIVSLYLWKYAHEEEQDG